MTNFPASLQEFRPNRLLGRGGFGEVWLARQISLDRDVAIKIGLQRLESVDSKQRFDRECKALGRLTSHRNIVDVYTSGFTSDELPYIVMEYIDGGTLADQAGKLSEEDLRHITVQLCDGLQAAHDAGILHRDMKPENVFLRQNREVVIGDFGIARLAELGITATGAVPATIAYAAPETLEGHPPTAATDVYGIGLTIIATALGHNPFRSGANDSIPAILRRVTAGEIPDISHRVSPTFATDLSLATATDPAHRINTAAELRQRITTGSNTTTTPAHNTAAAPVHSAPTSTPAPASATVFSPTANPTPPTGPQFSYPSTPTTPTQQRRQTSTLTGALAVIGALVILAGGIFWLSQRDTTTSTSATVETPIETGTSEAPVSSPQPEPQLPLALVLGVEDYVSGTGLPRDTAALETNNGPANNTIYCNTRSDITGLEETLADIYLPLDGTLGAASQRVMRFDSEENASNHLKSFVETTACRTWSETVSGGGSSTLTAIESTPTTVFSDETVQIDLETLLPTNTTTHARAILVRDGTDVLRISFTTTSESRAQSGAENLTTKAVDALSQ